MNATYLSLHIASLISFSPLFQTARFHLSKSHIDIEKSSFSHFFSNVLHSFNARSDITIRDSGFSYTLSSAISLQPSSQNQTWCGIGPLQLLEMPITNFTFNGSSDGYFLNWNDHHIYFVGPCFDFLDIDSCYFYDCFATLMGAGDNIDLSMLHATGGGAILVNASFDVSIHQTVFSNCWTESLRGGALFITGGCCSSSDSFQFYDTLTDRIVIESCCFYNCSGLYGASGFLAGNTTIMNYSSTLSDDIRLEIDGAHIDIQAEVAQTNNLNITSCVSTICSGIEYRRADSSLFQFHTISGTNGSFVIVFSNITINTLIICCNLVNNSINKEYLDSAALINSALTPISIDSFCFDSNILNGLPYASGVSEIMLKNCVTNGEMSPDNQISFTDSLITLNLGHLNLYKCDGNNVDPHNLTRFFTPSDKFTASNTFTESKYFTPSHKFTASYTFTQSNHFTPSDKFTPSQQFKTQILYYSAISISALQTSYNEKGVFQTFSLSQSYLFLLSMTYSMSQRVSYFYSEITIDGFISIKQYSTIEIFHSPIIVQQLSITNIDVPYHFTPNSYQPISANLIIGVALGVGVLFLIISIIIIFLMKRKGKSIQFKLTKSLYDHDIYTSSDYRSDEAYETETKKSRTKGTQNNPLFNENSIDDPFANDFDNNN